MILIDGYNLLHVTGVTGRGIADRKIGPGTLERARTALLNFLAASLTDDERQLTTIVFDSSNAPPGLPRDLQHQGIAVKYATGYESADELLEDLIRKASAPRKLTVVSSDHRVQRAAKRRKARAVDSDVWCAEIRESRCKSKEPLAPSSPKPASPLSEDDVAAWLDEFGDVCTDDPSEAEPRRSEKQTNSERAARLQIENPFPPGYAEDLLDEQ
jgi:hypothetical protein